MVKWLIVFVLSFLFLGSIVKADKTDDLIKSTSDLNKKTDQITNLTNLIYNIAKQPKIITSGTEYLPNTNGSIFCRLLDSNSNNINLGQCNATIYYPNKTKFLNNQPLTFLEKGFYYYDFTTPNISGNYIVGFDCIFPSSVFNQNLTINSGIGASPTTYSNIFAFDNNNNVTINKAWIYYNVTGGGGGATNEYYFNGQLVGTLNGVTQILNVTLNQSNFIIGESQQFAIVRTALSSTVNVVKFFVNYTYNNPLTTIRGQNEIHITDLPNAIWTYPNISINISTNATINTTDIWTYPDRTLTQNITQNDTEILNAIYSTNQSLFDYLDLNFNQIGAEFNNVYLHFYNIENDIGNISSFVKNMSIEIQNNFTSLTNHIDGQFNDLNNTITGYFNYISAEVANQFTNVFIWLNDILNNQTQADININGNFTYTNNLITNINTTQNLTAYDIWNYPDRNITNVSYVENVQNVTNVFNATVTNISDDVLNDIAEKVIAYFWALKDQLLTLKLL